MNNNPRSYQVNGLPSVPSRAAEDRARDLQEKLLADGIDLAVRSNGMTGMITGSTKRDVQLLIQSHVSGSIVRPIAYEMDIGAIDAARLKDDRRGNGSLTEVDVQPVNGFASTLTDYYRGADPHPRP